jgi:hypothetical protein
MPILAFITLFTTLVTTNNMQVTSIVNSQASGDSASVNTTITNNVNGQETKIVSSKSGSIKVVTNESGTAVTTENESPVPESTPFLEIEENIASVSSVPGIIDVSKNNFLGNLNKFFDNLWQQIKSFLF